MSTMPCVRRAPALDSAISLFRLGGRKVALSLWSKKERKALLCAVRAAVAFCRESKTPRYPASFSYGGHRFYIRTTGLGGLALLLEQDGEPLVVSGYGALDD